MLLGRGPEQQRIAELVAGARLGQSGVLVIRGEAGIGKTALIDDTAAHSDMTVLRASGTETESNLAFSGLHQLLHPALHLIDRLPKPQSDALAVALMVRDGPAPERFAVGAATLSLLSRYAEDAPLLVLVDDAHLLDPPSADAVRFVARRLLADPIAVVISARPEPDSAFTVTDLPVMELSGLDLSAAAALIAASAPDPATAELAEHLHSVTLGSPLALIELSRDIERVRDLSPVLPVPVSDAVAQAFGRRAAELPAGARSALLLAVVADGDVAVSARAAPTVGAVWEAIVDAESVGLVRVAAGRVDFRHPLVRSAVYAAADAHTRRAAHRAVAAALPATAHARRVWHRSAAAVGPDDEVADELVVVAEEATARGAHGVAAVALARSAELTTDDARRCGRLIGAGEAAWFAGHLGRARQLIAEADDIAAEPTAVSEISALRGHIALRSGSLREAHRLLVDAAAGTSADPDATVALLADAVTACFYMCDTAEGVALAERIEALLPSCRTGSARVRGQLAVGVARIIAGADGVRWLRTAVDTLNEEPSVLDDPRRPDWSIVGALFLRESTAGRSLVQQVVHDRRQRTAIGALPNLLFHTARDDATSENWQSALASYAESVALARETSQTTDLATSLAGLAWLQARMGRFEEACANATEARQLAQRHHITFADLWAQMARGDLELARGNAADAIAHYQGAQNLLSDIGFRDVDLSPGPELAEAHMRHGDTATAREVAVDYLIRAQQKQQPWALARAHRAVALTATDTADREAHFAEALRLHDLNPDRFEAARTRLALGASLRRAKKRVAARPHLRAALEDFQRLGAGPWAEAAVDELEAAGERARRGDAEYSALLTSQELRIAQMLGRGATTKEAAAALFLSPKTVEYHLRNVYHKLGINSRSELRAVVVKTVGDPA
ncbi:LuxR C-terminal-related transcriptional regulator [Mycolicibacterium sp.]|uniref:LuxR C-terminal-related transcriptional regulator n=1 Tax=Mycolicibacterium sp. TaxID=2320850 RepID=UPI003D0DEB23